MGLWSFIRLGAELDMAPIASLQGDLLPHVSGGRGITLWRHPDGLLYLSLAWEGPLGQHLVIFLGLGRVSDRRCLAGHFL